jgi:hypothetical protein
MARSFFIGGLQGFGVEKVDCLPRAIFTHAIRHSDKLAAGPRRGIGAKADSVPEKSESLFFRLAMNKKPAVQRLPARVNRDHKRPVTCQVVITQAVFDPCGRKG